MNKIIKVAPFVCPYCNKESGIVACHDYVSEDKSILVMDKTGCITNDIRDAEFPDDYNVFLCENCAWVVSADFQFECDACGVVHNVGDNINDRTCLQQYFDLKEALCNLRPCPFCGSHNIVLADNVALKCADCKAETGWHSNVNELINAWNNRVEI